MPLKRKLLFYLVVPALLLIVIGYVSITALLRLEGAANNILSDNYRTIQSARNMKEALWLLEEAPVEQGSLFKGEKSTTAIQISEFEKALGECEANITERGEKALLEEIRNNWSDIKQQLSSPQMSEADAAENMVDRIELLSPLYKKIGDLIVLNENAMFNFEKKTRNVARLMVGVTGISLAVTLAALVIFALVAANRISGPILAVTGDLHSALNPHEARAEASDQPVDEIERLRKELDDLLERLRSYEDEQVRKLTRLQARLAFVIEEVSEGLILLDTELNILGLNRIGKEILKTGDKNGGALNLYNLDIAEEMKDALKPIVEKGAAAETNLPEIQSKTGDEDKTYRPRLLPFKSSDGMVDGYLLVFWDVTEQKKYEESRRKFVSMLSHQLKTPVTSLSMSVNLINETFKGQDEETDDLLRMVKADCSTLTSLVTELIEAAQDMTPTLMLHRHRVDLSSLLKSALKPLVTQAEEKGIKWEDSIEAPPIFTDADPVKFPWVVTNIVGNALRYTKEGGTVSLALKTIDQVAEIRISDTGIGIAQEDLKKLFMPFTSLEKIREPGSIGLGLTIAKEIVDAHRGTIEVESEIGKGTVFTIRIPLPVDISD